MPELPEVESIKIDLSTKIIGKTIAKVTIFEKKQFIGDPQQIIGQKINAILRYGKHLSIKLTNNLYLNIHLKLTGQFLFAKNLNQANFKYLIPFTGKNNMPGKTTRIIFNFTDNSGLFFNDLRKFGWIKIAPQPQIPEGVDVLSKKFTIQYLQTIFSSTRRAIKIVLMDQRKMAGIGNIYANDSLFLAKINPLKPANSLNKEKVANLYEAIKKVINEGIKDRGSSAADEAFILPDGRKGSHQKHLLIYQKDGQPCPVCNAIIRRIKQGGRSTFYCPHCQKIVFAS